MERLENTTLDVFDLERVRCRDRYGDEGTIVGYHKPIKLATRETDGWNWVIRDRDNALIGIKECNIKWKDRNQKRQ